MITNTIVWMFSAFMFGVAAGMLVAGAFWAQATGRIVDAFERETGEKK